ncbi:RHS repeat-associated core domain-containing protein [Allorhizocola rhizosphaerae]|uniref:RHS repeat-associated core domain-containing protein n=1 Tax=Allorhizocola rhizosphaerae TaxID=1872709 RepID=UPI0013C2A6AA|nr:RHS repeat-associated core domain-containing protein [Allorhizocola rhizosphaerae]
MPAVARQPGAEDRAQPAGRAAPRWPAPGTTTVELPTSDSKASTGAVAMQRLGNVAKARVETLDPQRVSKLGGVGLGVRVQRADGDKNTGRLRLTLDYSGFATAYNAGFAARLRVFRLPACVVDGAPGGCPLTREPVAARNDLTGYRMDLETDAVPAGEPAPVLMLATTSGGSFAGNFGATDLAPSGKWQTGLASGSFEYSYPVPQPPSLAGSGPDLKFEYSSSAVDGMTASTNAQAGWTGLGWSLNPGFIERRYKPCADDATGTGKKASQKDWGHLCWESPDQNDGQADTNDPTNSELQLSLKGRSTRIVKDRASGGWKTQEDYGWTVQYLTGGASGQPYWQITTLEGDVYRFGYRRDSMWQVPFAGDDPGEPCNNQYNSGGSQYPGMCQGPWRWNLDQLVDVDENLTTYHWKREAWRYAWHADEVCCADPPTYRYTTIDYDRGGYLDRIEWGSNLDVAGSQPTARMVFNMVSRCSSTTTRDDPLSNPYPIDTGTGNLSCTLSTWDVPDELLHCDSYQCPGSGPSFFIVRRLDSIVTYSRDPVTGVWEDATKLQLRFRYLQSPENGNGECCTPALWLDYIRPVGLAGAGELRLPPVDFDAVELNGRVNWGPDWWFSTPKAILPRISAVHNGFGGRIEVSYGRANPCPDGGTDSSAYDTWHSGMQWDRVAQDCFRTYDFWFPFAGGPEVFYGIYHKYQVTKVVEKDAVGGSPDSVTAYEYQGQPAWALPIDYLGTKMTVPAPGGTKTFETASWNESRGYATVRTLKGGGTDPSAYTVTTDTFLRGMYDDPYANGTLKQTTVTDFDGNVIQDRRLLGGKELEQRTWRMTSYNANPALRQYTEIESQRHEYQVVLTGDGPGVHDPAVVNQARTRSREALAAGGFRYSDKRTQHNAHGLPTVVNDYGQDGVAHDNTCTTTTYVMHAYPATVEERAGDDCVAGPMTGKTVKSYDSDANLLQDTTWTSPTASSTVHYTYDAYGRKTSTTDELNRVTTTAYQPAVGWPYNGVTVTNPLGHRTTTWTSLLHGQPVKQSDVDNNRTTEIDYDQLGRTVALWEPGEPRSAGTPSATAAYTIPYDGVIGQPTAAPKSVLAKLRSGSGTTAKWETTHTYSDGLGRDREVQKASPAGGRVVTPTMYDGRGLKVASGEPVHNTAAAGSGLLNAATATLPSWSRFGYDGAERETVTAQQTYATEVRRKTVQYQGAEGRTVTPPAGGSTEYWTDMHDNVVRVVERVDPYAPFETRLEWDRDGNLTRITDARGNVRTYTYDWAGRKLTATDPDSGTTTNTYDAAGNLLSTVDGRGQRISHVYDGLNRRVATWAGDPGTGTKLAEWRFDIVLKGQPAASVSYSGGNAYTEEVLAYDTEYRPTRTIVTLPAAEGALAGGYEFTAAYDRAGNPIQTGMPAVPAAGLAAEKVTTTYTDLGFVNTLTSDLGGGFTYVAGTSYSPTGRPTERRYGGSAQVKRTMAWDAATNRLTNVGTWVGTVKKQDDDFHYDHADNVTRVVDKALATPQSECFSYDLRHRLTFGWTTTKPDCSGGPFSNPDSNGPDPYWRSYGYDATGNMTWQDTSGRIGEYVYPAVGAAQSNAVTKIKWPDREDSFGYDAAGHMTSRVVAGQTTGFEWDALGRLSRATAAGQATEYVYEADGDRLVRRDPGRTNVYIGQLELELTGTVVSARRYYTAGDGAVVAVRSSTGGLSWLLGDSQRSEQLSVEDSSAAVQRQRYLPFGAHRGGRDDITSTERGFLGKVEDGRTGLDYLGARYYDPAIAKFISADPLLDMRMPEWLNPYAYANNNPISRMDPSGLKAECNAKAKCETAKADPKKPKPPGDKCKGKANCTDAALRAILKALTGKPWTGKIPEYLDFYHATTPEAARNIKKYGIDLSAGGVKTDFGQGFYVTTDLDQAQDWAKRKNKGKPGAIVHFRVRLDDLLKLSYKYFPSAGMAWGRFVLHHRRGGTRHHYDWVAGPLLFDVGKALRGIRPLEAGGSQLSIHTRAGVRLFNAGFVRIIGPRTKPTPPRDN